MKSVQKEHKGWIQVCQSKHVLAKNQICERTLDGAYILHRRHEKEVKYKKRYCSIYLKLLHLHSPLPWHVFHKHQLMVSSCTRNINIRFIPRSSVNPRHWFHIEKYTEHPGAPATFCICYQIRLCFRKSSIVILHLIECLHSQSQQK